MQNPIYKKTRSSMEVCIAQALKTTQAYAFVSMNIKNFKAINLRFDYDLGNLILQQISHVIEQELYADEAYLQEDGDAFELWLRYDDAHSLQERLYRLDDCIYQFEDERIHQSLFLSFGIYTPQPYDTYLHMRTCANFCRQQSEDYFKLNTHIEFYQDSITQSYIRKQELASTLRKGFVKQDFHIVFQPKIAVDTEQIQGAEALLRWHDPRIHHVSTQEIILLSEQNGFVRELDLYIFQKLCQTLQNWFQLYHDYPQISVNVSRYHFKELTFFKEYIRIFETYNIPASIIEFEITESVMDQDLQNLKLVVHQMKEYGFHIALDDFGCGASSLISLKELPITTLKLDRSFFLNENSDSRLIVKAVLSLAQQLQIKTVCEGIETKEQALFLKNYKADYIQGYLYYPPLAQKEFEKLMFPL